MFENQNKLFLLRGIVSFLLLAGLGCARTAGPINNSAPENPSVGATTSANQTTSTTASSPTAPVPFYKKPLITTKSSPPKTVKPVQQYVKALETYQFRIQFDKCQASPGTITLKEGLPILLDNRGANTLVLKFGKQSYSVLGYDYLIAPAPTPGTYTITCNGGGAAEVQVQS